jgi:hypothetical protein
MVLPAARQHWDLYPRLFGRKQSPVTRQHCKVDHVMDCSHAVPVTVSSPHLLTPPHTRPCLPGLLAAWPLLPPGPCWTTMVSPSETWPTLGRAM